VFFAVVGKRVVLPVVKPTRTDIIGNAENRGVSVYPTANPISRFNERHRDTGPTQFPRCRDTGSDYGNIDVRHKC